MPSAAGPRAAGVVALRDTALFAPPMEVREPADCTWYHTMELPGAGLVDGPWDLRGDFASYTGHVEFEGRSVLDVGTASGFLSFSAEAAGAREVVSFDMDTAGRQTLLPFRDSLYFTDHAEWVRLQTEYLEGWKRGYWFAHRALGSSARVFYGDIYDLPAGLGSFDVVLLCAVLEHLADPIGALAAVSRLAGDRLVLNVYVPEATEQPLAWFLGAAARPESASVHWAYSLPVYAQVLPMLGFSIESVTSGHFRSRDGLSPRTMIVAQRHASHPQPTRWPEK